MYNSVAFVNAIIIASSVLSSVYSFPTLEPEAGLESILPIAQSTCFEAGSRSHSHEIRTMNGYAVDSEGRSCTQNVRDPNFGKLMNIDTFDATYDNETAEFCPQWAIFKECLNEHVNSDRCSADEKQVVLEAVFWNIPTALAEQLCNPSTSPHFRNLLKNLLNLNILECVFGGESEELQDECLEKIDDNNERHARFQDLGIFFECMKPGVRKCAKGDLVKEIIAVRDWEELDRAIRDGHGLFWNGVINQNE